MCVCVCVCAIDEPLRSCGRRTLADLPCRSPAPPRAAAASQRGKEKNSAAAARRTGNRREGRRRISRCAAARRRRIVFQRAAEICACVRVCVRACAGVRIGRRARLESDAALGGGGEDVQDHVAVAVHEDARPCVCVCVCVRAFVHVCVRVCVCARASVRVRSLCAHKSPSRMKGQALVAMTWRA